MSKYIWGVGVSRDSNRLKVKGKRLKEKGVRGRTAVLSFELLVLS